MNGAGSAKDLRHIPAASYIVYSSVPKLEAINSKLREFNSMLSASPENRGMTLGEADVAPGGRLDILLARYVIYTPLHKTSLSECRGLWSLPDQRWATVHTGQESRRIIMQCLQEMPAGVCTPCLHASRLLEKDRQGVVCKNLKSAESMCRSIEATTTGAAAQLSEEEVATLKRLLSWPSAYLFPALDISRMLVLSPSTAEDLAKSAGIFELSNPGMMLPDITPR